MADAKPVPVETVFGELMCHRHDRATENIRAYGNHTRPEFAFATAILQAGAHVFDLGAHIGTFALVAAGKVGPSGRVLAVEGNPATFALLQHNTAARPQIACLARFVGAGGAGGAFSYAASAENAGAGHLVEGGGDAAMTDIDSLAATRFRPSFIKIDVEGMEARALLGSAYVREARPALFVEINAQALARFADTAHGLMRHLDALGYAFFVNAGPRNAGHDLFRVARQGIAPRRFQGTFDALCIDRAHPLCRDLASLALPRWWPKPARPGR